MIKNSTFLITGGTGSFGNAVLDKLLSHNVSEIRIFSRDEKKQDDMRKKYQNSKIKFYIGDIRDYESVLSATRGCDFIFHAAALKQVPSCEFFPMQAVKTNILGTDNILEAAIRSNVKKVICLSTDKAVYPINAMGLTKALMEKVAISKSRECTNTTICITRYGNVMGSRGSVIPLLTNQIKTNKPLTLTDPNMTRFMMTLDDAVELVMFAFLNGENGELFVQKSPSASLQILAEAIKIYLKSIDHPIDIIGTRHGEKLYEVLLSREEMAKAIDLGNYFSIKPDLRELNYSKFIDKGATLPLTVKEYNSHNTKQLDIKDLIKLLSQIDI